MMMWTGTLMMEREHEGNVEKLMNGMEKKGKKEKKVEKHEYDMGEKWE